MKISVRSSELLVTLDFRSLNAVDPITASLALHVVASQMIHLVDEDLPRGVRLDCLQSCGSRHAMISFATDLLFTGLLLTDTL